MSKVSRKRIDTMLRGTERRLYEMVRSSAASTVTDLAPTAWRPSHLGGQRYCLLVTYRRDGRAVPTPVWFGVAHDRVYVRSAASDGKIKRIRRDDRVLIAACTARGAPISAPIRGIARILPPPEHEIAERAISNNYGPARRLYGITRARLLDPIYLEIVIHHAISPWQTPTETTGPSRRSPVSANRAIRACRRWLQDARATRM